MTFQLTAARRRLANQNLTQIPIQMFQLTAARRRLASLPRMAIKLTGFNSQPPEGGWKDAYDIVKGALVSTHSRPKAAGCSGFMIWPSCESFNSQPPEGGWGQRLAVCRLISKFQLTAARRRLAEALKPRSVFTRFNSQPPEGGWIQTVQ